MIICKDIKHYLRKDGYRALIDPGLICIILYRIGSAMFSCRYRKINPFWYIYLIVYSIQLIILKIELPPSVQIGENFYLAHPYGLVMGGKTVIGDNVTIGPWVVIGHNFDQKNPVIGNNCYIGAHACIFGGVTIGDDSTIGAGAVIIKDLPTNSIAYLNFNQKIKRKVD